MPTPLLPVLRAPIRTLLNPDTGSHVTLVGMLHAAQADFYATVARTIAELEAAGAMVHYEQVRLPDQDELAATPELGRAGVQMISQQFEATLAEYVDGGLVLQRDQLPPADSWENHDISMIEAVRFYGPSGVREMAEALATGQDVMGDLHPLVTRALMLQALESEIEVAAGRKRRESVFQGIDRQLSIHREALALAAVDLHLVRSPGSDLVLLWGVAHLAGLTSGLIKRGYKVEDGEQWVVAVDPELLPPLEDAEQQPPADASANTAA